MGSYSYLNPNGVFNNQPASTPFMQPNQPYSGGPTRLNVPQQSNSLGYDAMNQTIAPISSTPMANWGNPGGSSSYNVLSPNNIFDTVTPTFRGMNQYSNGSASTIPTNAVSGLEPANMSMDAFNNFGNGFTTPETPDAGFNINDIFDSKGTGASIIGYGNLLVSGVNTWMNAQNQKFMKDYYGKQQAMQEKERVASVTDANRQLSERSEDYAINTGNARGSQGFKDSTAAYMDKWRVA